MALAGDSMLCSTPGHQTLLQGADQSHLQGAKPGVTRSGSTSAHERREGKDLAALLAALCTRSA